MPGFEFSEQELELLAKAHVKKLRRTYRWKSTGNFKVDLVIWLGPKVLLYIWRKLSPRALTMTGLEGILMLIRAMETILDEKIEGDFIEAGIWRGGIPIIMKAFLEQEKDKSRVVWLADSFLGMPMTKHPKDYAANLLLEPLNYLAVERKEVERAINYFGFSEPSVRILEGWFNETLGAFSNKPLALIRLDGDYYESTRDAINALYPKLSIGGFIIIDDYGLPLGCRKAVDEFRLKHQISEPLERINRQAVYWRKKRPV